MATRFFRLASAEQAHADDLKTLAELRKELDIKNIFHADIDAVVEAKVEAAALLSQQVTYLQQTVVKREKELASAIEKEKKVTEEFDEAVAVEKAKNERLEAALQAKEAELKEQTEEIAARAEFIAKGLAEKKAVEARKVSDLDAQLKKVTEEKAALAEQLSTLESSCVDWQKRHLAEATSVAQLRQQLSEATQALEERRQAEVEAKEKLAKLLDSSNRMEELMKANQKIDAMSTKDTEQTAALEQLRLEKEQAEAARHEAEAARREAEAARQVADKSQIDKSVQTDGDQSAAAAIHPNHEEFEQKLDGLRKENRKLKRSLITLAGDEDDDDEDEWAMKKKRPKMETAEETPSLLPPPSTSPPPVAAEETAKVPMSETPASAASAVVPPLAESTVVTTASSEATTPGAAVPHSAGSAATKSISAVSGTYLTNYFR